MSAQPAQGMFEEVASSFRDYSQLVELAKSDPELRAAFITHLQTVIARFEGQLRNSRRRKSGTTPAEIGALLARARWILLLLVEPGERS